MELDEILVSVLSLAGITFTYWFFLMKKEDIVKVNDSVDVLVKGGYNPETIEVEKGKTTKINFKRIDPSSCLEEVVLPDFKIRKYLPMNEIVTLEIRPEKPGTYEFVCGMNMFHGKLIVT